jgi:TPR repeat protein
MPAESRGSTHFTIAWPVLAAIVVCLALVAGRFSLYFSYSAALEDHSRGDYAKALPIVYGNAIFENAGACGLLGTMYLFGQGVPKNGARAEYWLKKAAGNGSVDSQLVLGTMYASGKDVPRDIGKAQIWLSKAASSGDIEAGLVLRRLKRGERV